MSARAISRVQADCSKVHSEPVNLKSDSSNSRSSPITAPATSSKVSKTKYCEVDRSSASIASPLVQLIPKNDSPSQKVIHVCIAKSICKLSFS